MYWNIFILNSNFLLFSETDTTPVPEPIATETVITTQQMPEEKTMVDISEEER